MYGSNWYRVAESCVVIVTILYEMTRKIGKTSKSRCETPYKKPRKSIFHSRSIPELLKRDPK